MAALERLGPGSAPGRLLTSVAAHCARLCNPCSVDRNAVTSQAWPGAARYATLRPGMADVA